MRNITIAILACIVAIGLTMSVFAVQGGNGGTCGMRAARMGGSCPMKNAQAAGTQQGKMGNSCPMGKVQPGGEQKGWWNTVKPTTPEQKAFVNKVKALHEDIRAQKLQIAKLEQSNANKESVQKAQKELKATQSKLQKLMQDNKELRQQMNVAGNGKGNCPAMKDGTCPKKDNGGCAVCPKADGTGRNGAGCRK